VAGFYGGDEISGCVRDDNFLNRLLTVSCSRKGCVMDLGLVS
jgi:hypothetical protein